MHRSLLPLFSCALVVASPANAAQPAPYPSKPIRIVVGFPAGSGTDMLARFVGGRFTDRTGRQVVVDNRPGANGIIAAELTSKAPPDGYTLLFMSTSHTMNAAVYKLPFEPVKSFTPVMQLGAGPLLLVATPALPASNARGLVDLALAKPNTITYAVSGTGGINHFAGALFSSMTGTQLVNVPYKGGPQALTDLIAGQVQVMFGTAAITLSQVRSGRLKALGVSTRERSPLLPDVPTIAEAGVKGYAMNTWWGVLAPAHTPQPVVDKLFTEFGAILKEPESMQRLTAEGAQTSLVPSAEFTRLMTAEIDKWQRVARDANIKAD